MVAASAVHVEAKETVLRDRLQACLDVTTAWTSIVDAQELKVGMDEAQTRLLVTTQWASPF